MAMNAPVIYAVAPFDAADGYTFNFAYSGNQSVKNTLLIKDNSTLSTVYNQTLTTFQLSHHVPAGWLTNGKTYTVEVRVYDIDNNASPYSAPIVFKCFSKPIFRITNLSEAQTIKSPNVPLNISYSQSQGEQLNSYQVFLYDANKFKIFQSGHIFDVNSLTYTLENLQDDTSYYVQVVGETISGMKIDTGYIGFHIDYIVANIFNYIEAHNDSMTGTITIDSNMISIDGKYNGKPIYINGAVNLTNGIPVIYDAGFNISGDFSAQLKVSSFVAGSPLLTIGNSVTLSVYQANTYSTNAGKYYIQLIDASSHLSYVLNSNMFSGQKIQINLRRIGTTYDLNVLEVA